MIKRWLAGVVLLSTISGAAFAQLAFIEGTDYQLITPPVETSQPDKVVVTEIFWYGCPHCFRFEPYAQRLAAELPDGAVFEQVPSSLNPSWTVHARAFYAFELMGVLDQIHQQFFDAIHLKRQRLDKVDAIAQFVAEQGLDEKLFLEYYNSFPVETKMRKNSRKEQRYGHGGVPAVIVNGKYLVTGSLAGSNERMVEIIKYLVGMELARLN
jgi:thiol:disulfide interchange protein DsbA